MFLCRSRSEHVCTLYLHRLLVFITKSLTMVLKTNTIKGMKFYVHLFNPILFVKKTDIKRLTSKAVYYENKIRKEAI